MSESETGGCRLRIDRVSAFLEQLCSLSGHPFVAESAKEILAQHRQDCARAEAAEKERDAAWADSRRWRGIARGLRHFVPGGHAQYSIGTGADRDAAIGRYDAAVKAEKEQAHE